MTVGGDIAARSDWSPTKDKHLTTKKYVDDQLQSAGASASIGFGIPYMFKATSSKTNLSAGEFTLENNTHICCHRTSATGEQIGTTVSDYWDTGIVGFLKIYSAAGVLTLFHKYDKVYHGQDSNKHMKWHRVDQILQNSLSNNTIYYLADGMLLPY